MTPSVTTLIATLRQFCGFDAPAVAPPREPPNGWPSSTKTPYENHLTGRLLSRHKAVDDEGRWWKIETRQDPFTGVITRSTKRITD